MVITDWATASDWDIIEYHLAQSWAANEAGVCAWCYGTGKGSRPGKLFGRRTMDGTVCSRCGGSGNTGLSPYDALRRLKTERKMCTCCPATPKPSAG